jgi:MYXO-CTERM domain-containing protein
VELTGDPTERTTAATDALLALASLLAIAAVRRRTAASFARSVWLGALGCTAAASALGAAAHGLVLPERVRDALWQPLYLALGVTMALFVVGAVRDWRGERAARRALLPMLGVALAFYGVTRAAGGTFVAFVVYEGAALAFALVVYLALARKQRRPGAAGMAAALAVSLGAGVVQAAGPGDVRLVWTFDHNGLFHLVQLAGVVLLAAGLGRLLQHPLPEGVR